MKRMTVAAAAALVWSGLPAAPLSAQEPAPPQAADAGPRDDLGETSNGFRLTGGVDLVSDYRFRGLSFSDEEPALQGSLNLEHGSGLYAGFWASSISPSPLYGDIELDLYAGYATEIASGTSIDVGLLYYVYPGGEDGFGPSDYFEPYASISHILGPVEATVGAAYAWDQAAIGNADNIYLYGDLAAGIPNTPLTVSGHLGYSDGSLAPTGDYLDWSIGLAAVFGPATLSLTYVDTDLGAVPGADATLVAGLGLAF